jgi:hypothetical protein
VSRQPVRWPQVRAWLLRSVQSSDVDTRGSGSGTKKSGRRRDRSRRPPTPPDVPFGIRRFLSTGQKLICGSELGFVRCVVWRCCGHRDLLRDFRPLTRSLGSVSPRNFCPIHTESTRDYPLMTGSVLHHPGCERLIRPLLPSASHFPTPYGVSTTRQADRLPRVRRVTFPAYTRRIYVPTYWHGPNDGLRTDDVVHEKRFSVTCPAGFDGFPQRCSAFLGLFGASCGN